MPLVEEAKSPIMWGAGAPVEKDAAASRRRAGSLEVPERFGSAWAPCTSGEDAPTLLAIRLFPVVPARPSSTEASCSDKRVACVPDVSQTCPSDLGRKRRNHDGINRSMEVGTHFRQSCTHTHAHARPRKELSRKRVQCVPCVPASRTPWHWPRMRSDKVGEAKLGERRGRGVSV